MRGLSVAVLSVVLTIVACASDTSHRPNDISGNDGGSFAATGGSDAGSTTSTDPIGGAGGTGGTPDEGGQSAADCFADDFVSPPDLGPDYDQFSPIVGSHCLGTNHQDITDVERVVFLGDSVTVGTPPTFSNDFYRAKLADSLAAKFGLNVPSLVWKSADPFNGTAIVQQEGAFASCSKWGARTDDLVPTQLPDCFAANTLNARTLVIMTMGGNDISSLTKAAIDGATEQELWAQTQQFVQLQRDALDWLLEPNRFPNGVFVVFANIFEFTDGTGDVESCDVSGLAGFDEPVLSPEQLADMVIWANEEFVKMAVETGTDAIFLLEHFCGHGFNADNPNAPCYRGPDTEVWFDMTCIHPNAKGHQQIADMFMSVVDE